MKIIFAGTSEFAALVLKTIKSQTNWDISLVISEPSKPSGRKNQLIDSPVSKLAKELNLNLLTPISIKDIKQEIADVNADVMAVVSYGQILPLEVLEIPKFKTVNIHPSILPRLRGPSPIQTVLKEGFKETGVSLMVIDEKMDHGPIISQEVFLVEDKENYLTLEFELARIASSMLIRDLPKYIANEVKLQEQNHAEATLTKLIKKEDGLIDWSKSASEIYNQWRAYINWPGTYTFFKDKTGDNVRLKLVEIEKRMTSDVTRRAGEVFTDESKSLYIACHDGAIKLIRVQPENSKVLSAQDFLNGHSEIIGQKLW